MLDKSPTVNPLARAEAAQARNVKAMKPRRTKIGPKAQRIHNEHRKAGRSFAPVGLGQFAGQAAAEETLAITLDSPIYNGRLCLRDTGGKAVYISAIKVDGKTVYTGSKLSIDVLKVPANEPASSKTVGFRIANATKSISVSIYFSAVGTAELWCNGYVDNGMSAAVDNDDDDDDDTVEGA